MFTLSGAHVFPLYDAAVRADNFPIIDVRHEQTAVFAAEATAKLTREPGLAVLTAGPGVTNGVSAVASAWFNGSPVLVLGGRAPQARWGTGALQELDQPPILAPVTKCASTVRSVRDIASAVDDALATATLPHRGPVFLDVPMDELFSRADTTFPDLPSAATREPDPDALVAIAHLLASAQRPVLVLGSDVWADGAENEAREFAESLGIPVVTNGMGRGILPAGHTQLVTRARGPAFAGADLVVVAGAPLDFRLGYGAFGSSQTSGTSATKVVHLADSADQVARHVPLAGSASGSLRLILAELHEAYERTGDARRFADWNVTLADQASAARDRDTELLTSTRSPIHPARIYGELIKQLDDDAVVIGDGGDFVSFAGRFVEPRRPGGWLDPGPYGCLGTGPGYALAARLARPSAQVALLLGDGAAGFSLMDVDSLVRHRAPVVMVVGNNGIWGLERGPMRQLYGYDVAAELRQETRYDQVVSALGGAGETVSDSEAIGPALDRAFASGVPYLVNVLTDPDVSYPRTTTGI
jgi:acetolactate synthase I/II/III large subunit